MKNNNRFIQIFSRHKVAANLLMAIMLVAGAFALMRFNIQFLPSFNVELVTVSTTWNGATAEDIENSIINPMEKELEGLDHLKKMTSISRNSSATIYLEFEQGTDMGAAVDNVREQVAQVRNLPNDAEPPSIIHTEPKETVARVIISGPEHPSELRPLAFSFEHDLLNRGIRDIEILGLPEQEVAIQIPIAKLVEFNLSLPQISQRIAERSQDLPAGTIGKDDIGRQLRSIQQHRSIHGFEQMPIFTDESGKTIYLNDIAKIKLRPQDRETLLFFNGKPAVELRLLRSANSNALTAAKILHKWLADIKPTLGKSVQLHVYDENWRYIQDRINLLLKNGLGGLILIIIILFIFLNRRVAFWVVVGIPTSFMAGLAVLYILGGSINMLSLFAFIMTLGIIVDDTIVVGEETLTNLHKPNLSVLQSIEQAAYKMLTPILSSSLTTICAFFPLFFISGIIGTIIFDIPLVVTCVIIASIIECFLILPGHLAHSFRRAKKSSKNHPLRDIINKRFDEFKEQRFRRFISFALQHRASTLLSAIGLFIISLGLLIGGHVNFTFFPTPDDQSVRVNIQFTSGTPPNKVEQFLETVNQALQKTDETLKNKGVSLVETAVVIKNYSRIDNIRSNRGEQYASLNVELVSPDNRVISNADFIKAWRSKIVLPAGVEYFSIFSPRRGPPGEDIDIQFNGNRSKDLKAAALQLMNILRTIPGISNIKDDLPFGQQQIVFELNSTGKALGMTTQSIGRQLRAAFNGQIVQIYHLPNEEIEVRVVLPDNERDSLATLEQFPIITPSNTNIPLSSVIKINYRQGPDLILHTDTNNTIHVTAKVDNKINNANKILRSLKQSVLPKLLKDHNLQLELRGKAEEQQETFEDMRYGLILGLTLIYIILAWVFASYGWPFVVLLAIPLGLTGAIFGHLIMGLDFTVLSLFGLFGLSGIVINDSIILLSEYKHLLRRGWESHSAIIEASCRRLRAVILTSMTTIAGLTPLLFETSLQAQFLIPMATSICFGLAYATILILIIVPVSLSLYEYWRLRLKAILTRSNT